MKLNVQIKLTRMNVKDFLYLPIKITPYPLLSINNFFLIIKKDTENKTQNEISCINNNKTTIAMHFPCSLYQMHK